MNACMRFLHVAFTILVLSPLRPSLYPLQASNHHMLFMDFTVTCGSQCTFPWILQHTCHNLEFSIDLEFFSFEVKFALN